MKNMHICNIVLTGHWQSDGRKALAYQPNWTNSKFLDTPKIIQLMNHLIEPWSSSKISFSNFLNLSRICLNNKTTYTNKVVYSTVPWADHPRKTMAGVEQVNFPSKALLRKSHTAKLWQEVRIGFLLSASLKCLFPKDGEWKNVKAIHDLFLGCVLLNVWCDNFFDFFQSYFKVNPLGMKCEQGGSCEAHNIWTVPCPSMPTRNGRNGRNTNNCRVFRSIFSVALDNSFASCHGTKSMPPPKF